MSYNAPFRMLLEVLGIMDERLPAEGMPPRDVYGLTVWVDPLPAIPEGARHRPFKLRVMCKCPTCGLTLSASRLRQHVNTATCLRRSGLAAPIPGWSGAPGTAPTLPAATLEVFTPRPGRRRRVPITRATVPDSRWTGIPMTETQD